MSTDTAAVLPTIEVPRDLPFLASNLRQTTLGRSTWFYGVRQTSGNEEVRAAQILRFLVYNLECQAGQEASYYTCLDADALDDQCDHLVVQDLKTGRVVGTCRLLPGPRVRSLAEFENAQRFDLSPFAPMQDQLVEVGKVCVHSEHRNTLVFGLLYKAIVTYLRTHRARYLLGSYPLIGWEPAVGAALLATLGDEFLAPSEWRTQPWTPIACPESSSAALCPPPRGLVVSLDLGARIASAPTENRAGRSVEVLMVLDVNQRAGAGVRLR